MGSRRLISRSYSADGRSSYYNGDNVTGNIRSSSRSYLSSVRPENRSTLCTVMAQLTEETQPSFEITLKSKAVSEACNVKFFCVLTGHPAPDVTWYKDDIQLDRYCGLPKYEISKDKQMHSLHIYNCTLEDAAIYQASARNNKGIVSCSGVLEVGTMSEYKIHQQYFAKIKQKAESKRRDSEEPKPWNKENNIPTYQEQRRTISPDRSQRKRRSLTEEIFRTSESLEDKRVEQCPHAPSLQLEAQLQKTTMVEKEKPRPDTKDASTPIPNGEAVEENDRKGLTYIYDSVQRTFNKQQPKTPLAKKIKILNGVERYGVDNLAETLSEERVEMEGASMVPKPTQSLHSKESQETFMEVKSAVQSQVSHGETLKEKESDDGYAPLTEDKKQTEQILVVPLFSKEPAIHESSDVFTITKCKLTGTNSKLGAEIKKTGNEIEENKISQSTEQPIFSLEVQPKYTFKTPPQVSGNSPNEADRMQSNNVTVTEEYNEPLATEIKQITTSSLNEAIQVLGDSAAVKPHPNFSICGTTVALELESSETLCEGRAALPQHPCELSKDQLSGKETSPRLKNVSMSRLQLLAEANAQKKRNVAAVTSESQITTKCELDVKSQQLPSSERKIATDTKKTPSLHNVRPVAFDETMQSTRDHSRGSNESHTVLITDLKKSPLKLLGDSESTSRYNVSSIVQQSQVETAIKSGEGTEIQVDKKVQVNGAVELQEEETNAASIRIVEMGTRTEVQQTKTEKAVDTSGTKTIHIFAAEFLDTEKEHNKMVSTNTVLSAERKPQQNALEQQIENVKENRTPVINARSAADPMRSQIGTIDKSLTCESPKPLNNSTVERQNVAEKWDEIKTMHQTEEGKRQIPRLEKGVSLISASHVNDKIMNANNKPLQSYNIITTTEQEAMLRSVLVPPISIIDMDTTLETNRQCVNKENNKDTVIDPLLESGSTHSSLKYDPDTCLPSTENPQSEFSSAIQKECCNKCSLLSNQSLITASDLPPLTSLGEKNASPLPITILSKEYNIEPLILKHGTEDLGFKNSLTPTTQLVETKVQNTEVNSPANLHQHGEQQTVSQNMQKLGHATQCEIRAETEEKNGPLIHHDSSKSSVKKDSMNSTPLPNPDCNPELRQEDRTSPVPSATPQELAAGARRKVIPPKPKVGDSTATPMAETHPEREDQDKKSSKLSSEGPTMSPSIAHRSPLLQPPSGQHTPAVERRSPCLRKKLTADTPTPSQEPAQLLDISKDEEEKAEKDKYNPFKAPQVIRKIRGEPFSDASGHLKLWCQFFNVLSESTVKWHKDEMEIAEVKRSAGDETQVALAIVQASSRDCGVYGCTITNEYGTDSTDILLSVNILAEMFLREDQVVGEEIEMTPLLFNKVLADTGFWGSKFFGRIMMEEAHIGEGCSHKTCRAKVIYGLEPVFESGTSVVIKVHNPIAYGGKEESNLVERNLDLTQQDCRYQNIAREYCKIFSAEAKMIENFGVSPEVIPLYLMNRPANAIPNATVEVDLKGEYLKYCFLDTATGRLIMRTKSELEQKCCALQHWIHQWTNGNLLFTRLEGVETKITNVGISVKTKGYQGFAAIGNPKVFEQFVSQHQCNFYCGLLSLRSLKDCLQTPARSKGSRSPLLHRKMAPGSSSPQAPKKIICSPAMSRKAEPQDKSASAKEKVVDVTTECV